MKTYKGYLKVNKPVNYVFTHTYRMKCIYNKLMQKQYVKVNIRVGSDE